MADKGTTGDLEDMAARKVKALSDKLITRTLDLAGDAVELAGDQIADLLELSIGAIQGLLGDKRIAAHVNAQLKLVAGDVNIARPEMRMEAAAVRRMTMADQGMREESFAEYHLYTLPRRTTIKENQSKQISLFKASEVVVAKEYEFRGAGHYYYQRFRPVGKERFLSASDLNCPNPFNFDRTDP